MRLEKNHCFVILWIKFVVFVLNSELIEDGEEGEASEQTDSQSSAAPQETSQEEPQSLMELLMATQTESVTVNETDADTRARKEVCL